MFVVDGRLRFATWGDGSGEHVIGVIDYEQHSGGRSTDDTRHEAISALPRRCHPEPGVDGQLGDDVLAYTHEVKHLGAERRS